MPNNVQWLEKFYRDWRSLNVLDALDVMTGGLQCDNAMFRRLGKETPLTALYCVADIFDLPARCFFIEWYGGPPRAAGWFKASLLAFVIDRCLYAQVRGWTAQVCDAIKMAERYGCYAIQNQQVDSEQVATTA